MWGAVVIMCAAIEGSLGGNSVRESANDPPRIPCTAADYFHSYTLFISRTDPPPTGDTETRLTDTNNALKVPIKPDARFYVRISGQIAE